MLSGCGEIGNLIEEVGTEIEDVDGKDELVTPTPTPTIEVEREEQEFFIPDNCDNPPKNISKFDGWKCQSSATQGGKIVCLLPYQFTWKPWKDFTDHHGVTMKCNKNDEHFDAVDLVLKSGKRISLDFAYCANYAATSQGKIGRQHFRSKTTLWADIQKKVSYIEMTKGNKTSCLKF